MKNRVWMLFVLCYVIALVSNFMPSIKYPDATLTIVHLLVSSLLFMSAFGLLLKKAKLVFLIGFGSSLVVYGIHYFDIGMIENLQYPLFVAFVTPLFGLNWLLQWDIYSFSFFVSMIYFAMWLCTVVYAKFTLLSNETAPRR